MNDFGKSGHQQDCVYVFAENQTQVLMIVDKRIELNSSVGGSYISLMINCF